MSNAKSTTDPPRPVAFVADSRETINHNVLQQSWDVFASEEAVGPPPQSAVDDNWKLPGPEELRDEILKQYDDDQRTKAWSNAAEAVKTYNDELITRWNKEMDTLLVYAGLFSAVLTAFNVQSYQLLQSAPTDDITAVLKQISTQLNSFALSSSFANSTQQSQPLERLQPPFYAPASAVWINTLWFSSLVCSLASASIALMVKQWLHELAVGVSGQERESARRRQYRLNGFLKWHIGTVVVVIPIVLQVALFLFLAGLVILLWTLHSTVAAITSSLVGILFIFQSTVTVLPSVRWDCCYLSPQALMVYSLVRPVHNSIRALFVQASWSWARFEPPTFWRENGPERNTFRATKKHIIAFCNQIKEMPAWRGQEQLAITSLVPARALDREMAVMACTTTSSLKHLEDMRAFFSDLSPKEVVRYFEETWALYERRRAEGLVSFHVHKSLNQLLLCALRHMLTVSLESRDAEWEHTVKTMVDRHSPTLSHLVAETDLLLTTMSVLAMNHSVSANLALSKVRHQISLRVSCSYSSIRNVMIMADGQMQHHQNIGADPNASLYIYLQCVQITIHCILYTFPYARSQGTLDASPAQVHAIRTRGREVLAKFETFLRAQCWEGVDATMPEEWRQSAPFLHFLSLWLERYAILPLTTLAELERRLGEEGDSVPGHRAAENQDDGGMEQHDLVTTALVEALGFAWQAARSAHPPPPRSESGTDTRKDTRFQRIEGELGSLMSIVDRSV
ncbi:hypothetical protein C8Q80DRAFT_1266025 [Daedaleopsis nitida]|nr:hypothetical protein C8Q80DRAFT_1266025 [Daedaleopsis nitida]